MVETVTTKVQRYKSPNVYQIAVELIKAGRGTLLSVCVGVLVYTLVYVYFPSKHNNVLANLLNELLETNVP
jgi:hypothetical protein